MIFLSFPIVFSILGIIFGALLSVLTAVFAILTVIKGAYRNFALWLVGFVICLVIVASSIVNTFRRVQEKVLNLKENLTNETTKYNALDSLTTKIKIDSTNIHRIERMKGFSAMVDDKYKIPADFYTCNPNKDSATNNLPFIYPYLFHYNGYGYELQNVLQPQPIQSTDGIQKIAYDKNMLLIKFERTAKCMFGGNEPEVGYLKIDLKTGKQEQYLNIKKLMEESAKAGYTGNILMQTIYETYSAWYSNNEED